MQFLFSFTGPALGEKGPDIASVIGEISLCFIGPKLLRSRPPGHPLAAGGPIVKKRTILVAFMAISAILGLLIAEIVLIDRPRAPVLSSEERFFERSQGVLDARTGLLWNLPRPDARGGRTLPTPGLFGRKAAAKLCARRKSGGPSPWRLPTPEELLEIAHCGPELKRCGVVLSREQKAVCLRRRPGRPSWSFWTDEPSRKCRDAKGRRLPCARAVRIFRGDCGEYGAVTAMRVLTSPLRVICVREKTGGKEPAK